MIVGITGNTGSGKSTLARIFAEWGGTLVDADEIGRSVWQNDPGLQRTIASAFGDAVLGPDGKIDRRRLGHVVFSAPDNLAMLDRILAEPLRSAIERALRDAEERSPGPVVLDAALLFDWGYQERVDVVVLILAAADTRHARIRTRDSLDERGARDRIARQSDLDARMEEADHVIENDGTLDELKLRAREVWESITDKDEE
ncbi:MAG: dephospho-CoA kinase [Gemmatimonadetes bacterium]|nr:dephospho-CoA kinase [Gemmatimonadota bacterium]